MPTHIGYLHKLGLDYGWGPTSLVQWILEHVHVYAGTPWWATIALTAVILRAVMVKSMVDATKTSAKLQLVREHTKPITDKMLKAQSAGDQAGVMALRQQLKLVHTRAGIQTWKAFIPMLQIFLGFGMFRLMRGMSSLPVPGFDVGGTAWFFDLTVKDPLYVLPVVTAGLTYVGLKVGQARFRFRVLYGC
jgi:YidC/Oxa1 family membrane protein insertase